MPPRRSKMTVTTGTVVAFTEMHAVLLPEPNEQHIAKVNGHDEEAA